MSEVYDSTKQKEKHPFARAIQNAGISRQEARELGFNIGKFLWRTCLDSSKRDVGGK